MDGAALAVDGARLSWRLDGHGPPVVLCNGIANDNFQWAGLRAALAGRAQVLSWDYRGHGASEPARDLGRLGVADMVGDLRAVLDAAGIERAPVFGYSMGVQVALEAWRRLPERIAGLGLVLGCAGRSFDQMGGALLGAVAHRTLRLAPAAVVGAHFQAGSALSPLVHQIAVALGIFERSMPHQDFQGWYAHLPRIHAATFRGMALGLQAHDANDLLPSVTVPTLVVSGGRDVFVRPDEGARIARAIPRARLLHLPDATHAGMVGHRAPIAAALVDLWEEVGGASPRAG